MKIVRFAAADDGGSQFIEIDFPVDNASTDAWGHTARRSAVLQAQSTMVTEKACIKTGTRLPGASC
jgi:hypothetical protein